MLESTTKFELIRNFRKRANVVTYSLSVIKPCKSILLVADIVLGFQFARFFKHLVGVEVGGSPTTRRLTGVDIFVRNPRFF